MERKKTKQPFFGRLILKKIIPIEDYHHFFGDLQETFSDKVSQRGTFLAKLWYWFQILKIIPPVFKDNLYRSALMFMNYLKIAVRNVLKQKTYSFINISGLAIGMAACILILAYVQYEVGYDRFHKNTYNIYRVVEQQHYVDRILPVAVTPVPLAERIKSEYPEILEAAALTNSRTTLVRYEDKMFYESGITYADASILKIFDIPLKKGDPNTVLNEINTAIITEEIAEKYFGDDEPIGKTLQFNNAYEVRVTGIADNLPDNTFLQFDFLVSFKTVQNLNGQSYMTNWRSNTLYTFLLLDNGFDYKQLDEIIREDLPRFSGNTSSVTKLHLQPLSDIHFNTSFVADYGGGIEMKYIYIFIAIAVSLLLIACINFMNLSTARSAKRANEVGMRKVVGATRTKLITQFIGESVLMAFISFVFALGIVKLLLPGFNNMTGRELTVGMFESVNDMGIGFMFTLVVGFIAGSYPALFLSSFKPVKVLKGTPALGLKNSYLRRGLVVTQFSISIALIVSTILIYKQLDFIRNKDLGIDKDQIMILPIRESMNRMTYEQMKDELLMRPEIQKVAGSQVLPGFGSGSSSFSWEGSEQNERILLNTYVVNYDFLETFGLKIVSGRGFSRDFLSDTLNTVILNETAVRAIGWDSENAVGKSLGTNNSIKIVGVVKDFHFHSLKNEIEPLAMFAARTIRFYSLKINTANVFDTVEYVRNTWSNARPNAPFDYFFLDSRFDNRYRFEARMQSIFGNFSILTVIIACLGLFGLASFTAEQRSKEIGVRKVLGGTVSGIVMLLSTEFGKLVLISNVLAWPIAYAVMSNWLSGFAYRIDIGVATFLVAGVVAFLVALVTVCYQAIKAAIANPINALKYE